MATANFADLGALTPQIQSPGTVTTGNVGSGMDWNALMIALGQAGQAFSAEEPQSWQHQIGKASAGWGQSKKMAKAAEKQGAERRANWELIKDLLAGGMTPAGTPGVTSTKISGNKAGGLPELSMSITPEQEGYENLFGEAGQPLTLGGASPTQPSAQSTGQPTGQKELADISPFSTSPGRVTAADLLGLTPEQIMAVTQQQAEVDKLKAGTFLDAMGLLGMPFKPTDQWVTSEPDELGRVYRTNITTGKKEQVSGPIPEKPLTFEQRKELARIPSDIPRGSYWSKGDDTMWVPSGQKPPAGYTSVAQGPSPMELARLGISLENLGLSKERASFAKQRAATTAAQNIRLMPKREVIKNDIEFYNSNAADASTTGFIWLHEVKKWAPDVNEAVEVVLPKDKDGVQVTMADIREEATSRKVSPEEVLKEVYDWMKKQEK